jgi:hypothetical protein
MDLSDFGPIPLSPPLGTFPEAPVRPVPSPPAESSSPLGIPDCPDNFDVCGPFPASEIPPPSLGRSDPSLPTHSDTVPLHPGPSGPSEAILDPDSDSDSEDDLEIDPRVDPLQEKAPISVAEWERTVRLIVPRPPLEVDPEQLRQSVTNLLARIRDVNLRSSPESQAEAESILASLPSLLRDPEHFVAGTFTACHAAWAALLEKSKRKSARTVLGWLRAGVKTRFVGTADAKQSKRDLVVRMLKRKVLADQIPHMLSGNLPHPVEFDNHKSFYDNWDFAPGEASKLVLWSAASIVREGEELPLVIHPLGVAFTGGKGRLIINSRYCNLFMKLLRFRYERLRDVLGFTKEGFYMANWDLKSGYYHALLHPNV